MSTSWLSTKAAEGSENQGVSDPTNDLPTDPTRISNDKGKRTSTYTTPHDEVLAELHRSLLNSGLNDPAKDTQVTSPEVESTGALPRNHTSSAAQQPSIRFPSSDVLIDPFDGSNLGVLMPHGQVQGSESQNPSQVNLINNLESGLGAMNANPVGSEAVWSQLSRVLDIQSEISKMHLEMESIGLRAGPGDWKGKRHQWKGHSKAAAEKGGRTYLDPSMPPGPRQRATSTVSTISSGEPEVDESGVNFHDEGEEKSRIRGEEFAKLSSQFEGRKEAIHDIMAKLDDLSKTLSEFHALPIPNIEFSSSRNGFLGITSHTIDTPPDPNVGVRRSVKKSSSQRLSVSGNTIEDSQTASVASPPTGPPLQQAQDEISPDIPTSSTSQVPALLVSSLELGKHPPVTESPVSNIIDGV